ncbi:ubiquitin-protein ligase E3C-like [Ornithodoros turicata]|uniref:ubiquitin-protein ligase E3C-like n=1 Tax=Ornithodoros turicata TaxID=34597 RepID=UPI003138E0BD
MKTKMYSFEGDFRQRPKQSFGGASKRKVDRENLLKESAYHRQSREECRRQQQAAVTIQSYVRGFLARRRLANEQRQMFTAASRVSVDLDKLLHRLIFFYDPKQDAQLLVWLSQQVLTRKDQVAGNLKDPVCRLRIRKLLGLSVEHLSRPDHTVAPSLRLLEVFTSLDVYGPAPGGNGGIAEDFPSLKWLRELWSFLVLQRNFYGHLCCLLRLRVPDPCPEGAGPKPPTPLAEAVLALALRPIELPLVGNGDVFVHRDAMIGALLKGLIGDSPQVVRFVVPALAAKKSLPTEPLLRGLLSLDPSPWSLHALMQMAPPTDPRFLLTLAHVAPCLVASANCQSDPKGIFPVFLNGNGDLKDPDNEDEEMQDAETSTDIELLEDEVRHDAVERINSPETVTVMVEAASTCTTSLSCLCKVAHVLLCYKPLAMHRYRLLYTLAFRPAFLRRLWEEIGNARATSVFSNLQAPLLQVLTSGLPPAPGDVENFVPKLTLFCSLLCHLLPTLHDVEFYETESTAVPFDLVELVKISAQLRNLCLGLIELCFPDTRSHDQHGCPIVWVQLFKSSVALLRQLYARDSRRSFCPDDHWIASRVSIVPERAVDWNLTRSQLRSRASSANIVKTREQFEEEGPPLSTSELRSITVLQEIPFVIPFPTRVRIFQQLISKDKNENQRELSNFLMGPQIQLQIRRNYIYEDAFDNLSAEPNLKHRVRIQLINTAGLEEAGIDGGGVFREFMNELLRTTFDPNRGLFRCTNDRRLYPNPGVGLLPDYRDYARHYAFAGRMLAKAIYEGMLVELPLAVFFLEKILCPGDLDIHHLASLDPLVYRNLLYLKRYEGDVSDLGLDFTVTNSDLGESKIEELKPNGASIPVTAANRIEYIHLMADYRLNKQIRTQCLAFKRGLAEVLQPEWLALFSARELQTLISGAHTPVDLDDLRAHTHYEGGYTSGHPVIVAFWRVVYEFDERRRRLLLKFVTSCSRPPLLGFRELVPGFCIQSAGAEPSRLPTASTCMNLLKLPEINDENALREKLLYAIESGAGFELS